MSADADYFQRAPSISGGIMFRRRSVGFGLYLAEPEVRPADDVERSRRRAFVAEHRTAVFGYPRRDDGPSMSVVYHVMDGDDRIVVSTMRDRGKAKAVAPQPQGVAVRARRAVAVDLPAGVRHRRGRSRLGSGHGPDDADLGRDGRSPNAARGSGRRRGNVPARAPGGPDAVSLCHLPDAPATRPGGDGPEGAHARTSKSLPW